ncbi:MAG: acetylglutamate kinase [Bacteroidota bacterium]|nr:acetylglutamate kinase [Bacteroidota bacterium]MDP4214808.1 acetylglutamate kinase [Bacteroidota bacterium]MDP4246829.1 acetylglutamate kinase [Bacteroidota bacterium]MDP4255979.1 acetylglutamate kinase [Bacteroidota bacterium]MDP4259006.1 acetylglutamate kinase [Bacteroidota bacterium]
METLAVIKIGGNIIDDPGKLDLFLSEFAALEGRKILVHGGGKMATQLAEKLGIRQTMIDGRRITDEETLKVVTMVYAGLINKNLVAQLQAKGCNAMGLSGADGNSILAHKRGAPGSAPHEERQAAGIDRTVDYGFAGDVDRVNGKFLAGLLEQDKALVFAPITHDGKGQLLNTNADTVASEIAKALGAAFGVSLVYTFEKSGVLMNADDDATVIHRINPGTYKELRDRQIIFSGMIPKMETAFAALDAGVRKVIIGKAEDLHELLSGHSGTTIVRH